MKPALKDSQVFRGGDAGIETRKEKIEHHVSIKEF